MKYAINSVFGFVLLSLFSTVYAATYYVEDKGSYTLNQTDDGATAFSNSTSTSAPCSPATAMAHAVAGDVVQFRAGTYDLYHPWTSNYWYNGAIGPANSGTIGNPITFQAYPGETVILDVDSSDTYSANALGPGANCNDYITYDGFTIVGDGGNKYGQIRANGAECGGYISGLVLKNMTLNGGGVQDNDNNNYEGIFLQATDGAIVENNVIYNYIDAGGWHNTSALKFYDNINLTIRNNTIYDNSNGIYLKRNNDNVSIYNNYVTNSGWGAYIATYSGNTSNDQTFYNNVFANNSSAGIFNETDSDSGNKTNNFTA